MLLNQSNDRHIFRISIGLIKIALAVLTILTSAQVVAAGDWPMFMHDAVHSGISDEVVAPPLGLLWKYTTGGSIISSPAVSGGSIYFGSNDYNLYALDALTGALKWNYTTGGWVQSSPLISGGKVYVGSGDNYIYALDALTGTLKWKYMAGGPAYSSPIISGGVVYVGSMDGYVYGLDAAIGKNESATATVGTIYSSPAVSGGIVYIGSTDGNMYAFAPMLNISEIPTTVTAGISSDVTFTVTSSGTPVRGATVDLTGVVAGSGITDSNGIAVISVNAASAGAITATASKAGLINASTTITVNVQPPPLLSIIAAPDTVITGSTTNVTFIVSISGTAISGALVSLTGAGISMTGITNSLGQVILTIIPTTTGTITATATKAGYADGSIEIASIQILSDEWPMFRHDIIRSGISDEIVEPPLDVKWNYTTGGFIYSSSPAISNGLVYVGSSDNSIYALDAATGILKWKYTTGSYVYTSPTVADGTVYIGSYDHNIYALDAATGTLKWKYGADGSIYSSPAVYGGIVYVGSMGMNQYASVYALDAVTGSLKWRFTTGGSVWSSPAVTEDMVYVGAGFGEVYALDALTGTLKWNYSTGGTIWSSPTISDGIIYIGSDFTNLFALDALTGALKWNYPIGGYAHSSPAVSNGTVFVGLYDGSIYAFDAITGVLKWKSPVGGSDSPAIFSSPAVSGNIIYVGSGSGIYALNTSTGSPEWSYVTGLVDSSPAISGGMIYIGSRDGKIYAFAPTVTPVPTPTPVPTIQVIIDIKKKKINPESNEDIEVAILTNDSFNNSDLINISSVRLGDASVKADTDEEKNVDIDGNLILRFKIRDTNIKCGDNQITLTGKTYNGLDIIGWDSIETIGCEYIPTLTQIIQETTNPYVDVNRISNTTEKINRNEGTQSVVNHTNRTITKLRAVDMIMYAYDKIFHY